MLLLSEILDTKTILGKPCMYTLYKMHNEVQDRILMAI